MLSLNANAHLVILTGAGISQESGIETFRDADGMWQRHSIDDVATYDGFRRDPVLVHDFYNNRRRQLNDPAIAPNAAHLALARLQRDWSGPVTLITQNIDNLHERAGHADVIHMHGELTKMRCQNCGATGPAPGDVVPDTSCIVCRSGNGLRPDIVWFGEMPYEMDRIHAALDDADLFAAIGTSGTVYPAAGFSWHALHHGAVTVEANLSRTAQAGLFHHGFYGPATEQVPILVDMIFHWRKKTP